MDVIHTFETTRMVQDAYVLDIISFDRYFCDIGRM